jgi:hypothetical protein
MRMINSRGFDADPLEIGIPDYGLESSWSRNVVRNRSTGQKKMASAGIDAQSENCSQGQCFVSSLEVASGR